MVRAVGLAGWLAVAAGALVCEVRGRRDVGFPTLADVVRACTCTRAGRLTVVGSWVVLGWHLFVQPPAG
ncbi:MAG: DUF6186 family protein [Acidimicrobiia bacterium]|jgi:hypothetical protein